MATTKEDLVTELAHHRHRVLIVAGAGISRATDDQPSSTWLGLLKNGRDRCLTRCHTLGDRWSAVINLLLEMGRPTDFIQAAAMIELELRRIHDGEYARWLADSVGSLKLRNPRTIEAIVGWRTRIATTNYDNLLEDASGQRPVVWDDGQLAFEVLRGDQAGILHVHGHYQRPSSVVLGAKGYEDICRDVRAQNLLRSILMRDTVVFIGCGAGVDDPNFGNLLEWSRKALETAQFTHYHIVKNCDVQQISERCRGLPITLVPYGDEYADLAPFLEVIAASASKAKSDPSTFDLLVNRQSDYEKQMRDLDAAVDIPQLEYLRQSFAIAESLWNAGGRRTAALQMNSVASKYLVGTSAIDCLPYAIQAAEYLIEDQLDSLAMALLFDTGKVLRTVLFDNEMQSRYRRVFAHCLAQRADLPSLRAAAIDAMQSATLEQRAQLEADLDEYNLLSGDFTGVKPTVG